MQINKSISKYGIILIILLIINIFFSFKFYKVKTELNNLKNESEELDNKLDSSEADYIKFKSDTESQKAKYSQTLDSVLPSNEDITNLNRQIEDFANSIDSSSSPIYLEKISYGNSEQDKNSPNLYLLPFSVGFKSSEENFYKMLKFIESSGNIENKVRLMEVTKIAANSQSEEAQEGESTVKLYSFQIEGNAYFYQSN